MSYYHAFIPTDRIRTNSRFQPFKELSGEIYGNLVKSVQERGILNPILVKKEEDGGYVVIDGHHRLKAAKEVGITEIPCVVFTGISDDEARLYSMLSNAVRRNLSKEELEEVIGKIKNFKISQGSNSFQISPTDIIDYLEKHPEEKERLLRELPENNEVVDKLKKEKEAIEEKLKKLESLLRCKEEGMEKLGEEINLLREKVKKLEKEKEQMGMEAFERAKKELDRIMKEKEEHVQNLRLQIERLKEEKRKTRLLIDDLQDKIRSYRDRLQAWATKYNIMMNDRVIGLEKNFFMKVGLVYSPDKVIGEVNRQLERIRIAFEEVEDVKTTLRKLQEYVVTGRWSQEAVDEVKKSCDETAVKVKAIRDKLLREMKEVEKLVSQVPEVMVVDEEFIGSLRELEKEIREEKKKIEEEMKEANRLLKSLENM